MVIAISGLTMAIFAINNTLTAFLPLNFQKERRVSGAVCRRRRFRTPYRPCGRPFRMVRRNQQLDRGMLSCYSRRPVRQELPVRTRPWRESPGFGIFGILELFNKPKFRGNLGF
jgi:hypothetical protein